MAESSNNGDLSADDLKDVSGGSLPSKKLKSDFNPPVAHDKMKTVKQGRTDPWDKLKDKKSNLAGDSVYQ